MYILSKGEEKFGLAQKGIMHLLLDILACQHGQPNTDSLAWTAKHGQLSMDSLVWTAWHGKHGIGSTSMDSLA